MLRHASIGRVRRGLKQQSITAAWIIKPSPRSSHTDALVVSQISIAAIIAGRKLLPWLRARPREGSSSLKPSSSMTSPILRFRVALM